MMRLNHVVLVMLSAAVIAPGGRAATNEVAELPSVVVTASPVTQEERVSADGVETVVVSRRQLDVLNAGDIQTALRQVPGVTVSRYAPVGSYGGAQGGSVYVRGFGTARPGGEIRMYMDGAPRESGVWSHPLMDSVPVDFAESVTVQKNPHPAGFAGTFAAVDVETRRRAEEGFEGEAVLAGGRRGTLVASAAAGMKEGPVDAYAGASHRESDGVRPHNRAVLDGAFARLGADLTAHERVSFIYHRTDSRVENPGEVGRPTPLLDRFDLSTDLYELRFDVERERLRGFALAYCENGAINWHKDHLDDANPNSPAGDADTFWLNWGARVRGDWNAFAGLWLVGAVDAASEGGSTRNTRLKDGERVFSARGRMESAAPYLGARYELDFCDDWRLTPAAGARAHFHSVYDDEAAPHASLKLGWRESVELFVTGSRAVHYPGVYTRAMASDYARETLRAEVLDYASVGVKAKAGDEVDALFAVFHQDAKDRIDKTASGYINSGSCRATGAELSVHWRPMEELAVFGGGTWTNPETTPVSRMPRWTFVLGASWKVCEYLVWSLDGQYIGAMDAYSVRAEADRAGLRHVDGAFIFNTRLSVPLRSFTPLDGEIFAAIENLADSKVEYYPGYPTGGIMWYIGCRVKFGN